METNLVGPKEMAEILKVPISWIYQRTSQGLIRHYKVGKYVRFSPNKVIESLKNKDNQ